MLRYKEKNCNFRSPGRLYYRVNHLFGFSTVISSISSIVKPLFIIFGRILFAIWEYPWPPKGILKINKIIPNV